MELIVVVLTIVAGFSLFGLLAYTAAVDSREQLPDDHRR
jgi:hypothetical protein